MEIKYPIYSIAVSWNEDGKSNCTGFNRMFKEPQQPLKVMLDTFKAWWPQYKETRKDKVIKDVRITVSEPYFESWCQTWFAHWTFDVGQTDEEALESFEQYVRRHEYYQYNTEHPDYKVCLMGAEDRWRWKGLTDDGEERIDPPCRCAGCKKLGVIRIVH